MDYRLIDQGNRAAWAAGTLHRNNKNLLVRLDRLERHAARFRGSDLAAAQILALVRAGKQTHSRYGFALTPELFARMYRRRARLRHLLKMIEALMVSLLRERDRRSRRREDLLRVWARFYRS